MTARDLATALAAALLEGVGAAAIAFGGAELLFAAEVAAVSLSATLAPAVLFGLGVGAYSLKTSIELAERRDEVGDRVGDRRRLLFLKEVLGREQRRVGRA